MNWDIQHIFMYPPITGVTINSVFLSPEFRIIEYCLIVIILIFGTIYFLRKKSLLADAFKKSFFIAFFASGLLYAIHADIGWTTWLITDFKNYWGLSTEDKLRKMDGDLYEFAIQAKKIINNDYQIYTSNEYMYFRTQYYLLPLVRHEQASYIVVIADNEAKFDADSHIFTRGATTIPDVKPVLVFAKNAYILKRY
jgi:hypothetical protein